ncbi:phosphotransferase family protein [Saccharopolyspora mangrovi]|uniref:Phosphotransferase family protein n=1 Tax=Saccharopolyspora mangrovi TaxID=3082379 RepID=A0ABU6AJD0_9PSEU|nr:phosphotransferase family protein [Saccharopolyspora sp. S2-29]MEB3371630.1 phosphotransferase family protein [Saccharopolyspora sp. S2-29]
MSSAELGDLLAARLTELRDQNPDYRRIQDPDYGGIQDPDYGGIQDPDYGGIQDTDYGGNRDTDYGGSREADYCGDRDTDCRSNQDTDYRRNRGTNYGGDRDADYGSNQDTDSGRNRDADYRRNRGADYGGDPGSGPVRVTRLEQASGGASRETWFVELDTAERLVLRRDPPGLARPEGMAREAVVLDAAAQAGVPVPELVDYDTDETVVGSPYVLTRHVDGETIPRRLLRDEEYATARRGLARELGRAAARIHRIPVPDGFPEPDPLEQLVSDYDALGDPIPAVEIAFRWLRDNRPTESGRALVHGDFRNGNLIVDETGLRAVLDWELVHAGDPMEDLGWLCTNAWRFGSPLPVGGFGGRDELFDGYAEVAGVRPDPDVVRWWEVFGTTKWGVICRSQAEQHLSGAHPSVELAAIGRRVCEQEHDLLVALGVPEPGAPQQVVSEASDLHGRPTAAELVAAARDFLREEVLAGAEGRMRFQSLVTANVLSTVERELRLGAEQERRHRDGLGALGLTGRAALAAALRAGEIDAWEQDVAALLWSEVLDRLAVANPKHTEARTRGGNGA